MVTGGSGTRPYGESKGRHLCRPHLGGEQAVAQTPLFARNKVCRRSGLQHRHGGLRYKIEDGRLEARPTDLSFGRCKQSRTFYSEQQQQAQWRRYRIACQG